MKAGPAKWKRPAWKWKNMRCPCGLWINRERIVEHAQTPKHKAWAEAHRRQMQSERAV